MPTYHHGLHKHSGPCCRWPFMKTTRYKKYWILNRFPVHFKDTSSFSVKTNHETYMKFRLVSSESACDLHASPWHLAMHQKVPGPTWLFTTCWGNPKYLLFTALSHFLGGASVTHLSPWQKGIREFLGHCVYYTAPHLQGFKGIW